MSEPARTTASRGTYAENSSPQGYAERATPAGSLKPLTLVAPAYCVEWAMDSAQPAEQPRNHGGP